MRRVITSFIAGLLLIVWEGGARAQSEEEAPDTSWKELLSTGPPGSFPLIDPCELHYTFSWNGVLKAGESTIVLGKNPEDAPRTLQDDLCVMAKAWSAGPARVLWSYTATYQGWIDKETLRPIVVEQVEHDRDKTIRYVSRFSRDSVHSEKVKKEKDEDEIKRSEREYSFPAMRELASAVLYLRSFEMNEVGESYSLVTFPFDHPYLVTLTVEGREKHRFKNEDVDSIRLDVEIFRIEKDQSLTSFRHKFKSATIWVSDDLYRLPLEVRAEIFVGNVRATLTDKRFLHEKATAAGSPDEESETKRENERRKKEKRGLLDFLIRTREQF